ncbi:hypothetical protein QR680_001909 [Steinernema hermaphroditum]|uniref:Cation efflux protein cytoplasmic domain-containing protein n=1 Tax=Steinernema hermaphroditum TaxID=289476 RepID=A0AA39LGJ6_9BILA|nr:hypothetical protein QR680_001909 [Steinernema hermaphroditum]
MACSSKEQKPDGDRGDSDGHGHGHSHSPCSVSRGTKLLIMISMTFLFFIVEMVFGYMSNSMALVADSFHMLSDVMALGIGFVCLKIAERNTKKNTFGWVRAEVLGALVNGVFLLALCFSIFVESITRLVEPHKLHDPLKVLVVGVIGLVINVIGLLMFHGHAHSHGPDPSSVQSELENNLRRKTPGPSVDGGEGQSLIVDQDRAIAELKQDFEAAEDTLITGPKKVKQKKAEGDGHLNMRGVFLHVASDAIGSVIVIITATIALYAPDSSGWNVAKKYMDPCLSIFMVILMTCTTLPLVRETALILLQTTPKFVNIEDIKNQLLKINGIVAVHEFHVWRLVGERIIATLHIRFVSLKDYLSAAEQIRTLFHDNSIHSATIQPEFAEMNELSGSESTECAFACSPSNCNIPDVSCCKKKAAGEVVQVVHWCLLKFN